MIFKSPNIWIIAAITPKAVVGCFRFGGKGHLSLTVVLVILYCSLLQQISLITFLPDQVKFDLKMMRSIYCEKLGRG